MTCYCMYLCLYVCVQRQWTPLYVAAFKGHMDVVRYLVEKQGCDPTVVTLVSDDYKNASIKCIAG